MGGETASELIAVLEDAQRLGFLGDRPIGDVVEHARGFVRALEAQAALRTVLDLGSGGGVPGLIIAHDLPRTHVTLLDRRAKRTDALERAVRKLGWQDRVSVVCQDATTFGPNDPFDAVVARGFGPPTFTLSCAARLVRTGGSIVISEPPGPNRWDPQLLARLDLRQTFPAQRAVDASATGSRPARTRPGDGAPSLDGFVATFVKQASVPDASPENVQPA